MAEYQIDPPHKPLLRPHRLIPAPAGAVPADGLPAAAVEQEIVGWLAASGEPSSPALAKGGSALAGQAWPFIGKAALTLDTLPTIFKGMAAPDEVFQTLELIGSILLALPDQMASGREASVARADWMFSRLINAPAQPGLIEQVIEALTVLDQSEGDDEAPADYAVEIEVLRCLHRDLVTLQQLWDDLIEAVFPVNAAPPTSPEPTNANKAGQAGSSADGWIDISLPTTPAPLPVGLRIGRPRSGGPSARSSRFSSSGKQRLSMLLTLLLLVALAATGVLVVQSRGGSGIDSNSAALSVNQHKSMLPTPVQPTPTQPIPTPTPKPPTPTPKPPTPTPRPTAQPTPGNTICPSGAVFCVSTLQLQVPCAGQGSVTFQLIDSAPTKESWRTFSSSNFDGSLVTITPARGSLKQSQAITLSVQANPQQENRTGTITILGPFNTSPITITVQVCS